VLLPGSCFGYDALIAESQIWWSMAKKGRLFSAR
jgi:hypothetical protein